MELHPQSAHFLGLPFQMDPVDSSMHLYVSFSILLDGSPFGKVFPHRGLRQGDPLSPFLFILGTEVLSRLIMKEEAAGIIHGIKISRNSPPVSHLLYADDLMVFSRGNITEAACILNCLNKFSAWSGQQINFTKSSLILSQNCNPSTSNSIHSILKLRPIPPTAKHLGLPLFFHRNKNLAFEDLKQKILNKISGWKSKLLSQAARTSLIKSVASSIPSYSMSLFLLPKTFSHKIDSAFRKFWWGFPPDKSHNLTLLGWNKICTPKAAGGLGIRNMEGQNLSLLSKLGWKILNDQNLLWVKALNAKYLHKRSFLNVTASPANSWLWKGILKSRLIIQRGACWAVSSGHQVSIWNDPWIPNIAGFKPSQNPSLPSLPNLTVSDLISFPLRSWNIPLLNFLFDPPSVSHIQAIHIPQSPCADRWTWTPSPSGRFSVKSAHEVANPLPPSHYSPLFPSDWKLLWGLKIQYRLKHFLWKLSWNILPLRPNIFRFSLQQDPDMLCCPICQGSAESLQHIFLSCPFARILWRNSRWPLDTLAFSSLPFVSWIKAILSPHLALGVPWKEVRNFQISTLIVMDQIWLARNKLIHDSIQPAPLTVLKLIKITTLNHLSAWNSSDLASSDWVPPPLGYLKVNFDVAIRPNFAVAASTLRDHEGNFLAVNSLKLPPMEVAMGEAHAALLASRIAVSFGCSRLIIEGDSLLTILAVKDPHLFLDWNSAPIISDIQLNLLSIPDWKAVKISRCANIGAHLVARWAASHLVFGSIPTNSPFISSIRLRSGKDPPL
jgi:hypothetical protein